MSRAYRSAAANEISAGACAAEVSATANEGTAAEVTAAANEGTAATSAAEVTATAAAAMAAAKGEGGIRNRDCREPDCDRRSRGDDAFCRQHFYLLSTYCLVGKKHRHRYKPPNQVTR